MSLPPTSPASADHTGDQTRPRLLALVGMPGAGKSMLAHHLEAQGFPNFRFGSITMDELQRRGWEVTPDNEKTVREEIRANEKMDAYAIRALPIIHRMLATHRSAIIDGLYSFSEWKTLKAEFGAALVLVAVACDRQVRYARLATRAERPLSREDAEQRDIAEIVKLEKGGPIAIADYTILNNDGPEVAIAALERIVSALDLRP